MVLPTIRTRYQQNYQDIAMLVGLCGGTSIVSKARISKVVDSMSEGICAGKSSVADFLTENLGFVKLHLAQEPDLRKPWGVHGADIGDYKLFANVESMLDFVTKQWQQRWVTTDIWNEDILENLLRRPFFILVSVDAPITLRWKRLKHRYLLCPGLRRSPRLTVVKT